MADISEREDRLRKLEDIKARGIHPYPEKYDKTHHTAELHAVDSSQHHTLEDLKESCPKTFSIAGRITLLRTMGKLSFLQLQDEQGKIQVAVMQDVVGNEAYKVLSKKLDLGDFIGVRGELFVTKHGEVTLLAAEYTFLGKALRPLPDKFHGVKDQELLYRKRYLDLISNEDTRKRFQFRSKFIKALREFYWDRGFTEIETPVLCNTASGALATPFKTHHKALDTDVYLRIAPETYLKEAVVGGFEKVFEVARVFRNEGIDPSHLQDFTMVEHYAAYWNYEDNMRFTEEMFQSLMLKTLGTTKVIIKDKDGVPGEVDFTGSWPRVTLQELILKDAAINIDDCPTKEDLLAAIMAKGISIDRMAKMGRGNLIDNLYKKVSRPHLRGPIFIIKHPIDLSPLARKNDDDPKVVDRFQLVVNTWEVLNAYSELVDPIDQAERFEYQSGLLAEGDDDAHGKDEEYVEAMEYGMPPISGWGMGIDRMVTLLTNQDNLRDVVLFPLMKPKG